MFVILSLQFTLVFLFFINDKQIAVDAVLAINETGKPTDLNMVEIMEMQHRTEADSRLVRGHCA